MATSDFSWGRIVPNPDGTITVKNTDSSNNFVAGNLVSIDATNVLSGTQTVPGAVLSANEDKTVLGVVVEAIAMGSTGRVQFLGFVQVVASAAISAGAVIMSSGSGKVATQTSGQPQVGRALTAASTNGDLVWADIHLANNA